MHDEVAEDDGEAAKKKKRKSTGEGKRKTRKDEEDEETEKLRKKIGASVMGTGSGSSSRRRGARSAARTAKHRRAFTLECPCINPAARTSVAANCFGVLQCSSHGSVADGVSGNAIFRRVCPIILRGADHTRPPRRRRRKRHDELDVGSNTRRNECIFGSHSILVIHR